MVMYFVTVSYIAINSTEQNKYIANRVCLTKKKKIRITTIQSIDEKYRSEAITCKEFSKSVWCYYSEKIPNVNNWQINVTYKM